MADRSNASMELWRNDNGKKKPKHSKKSISVTTATTKSKVMI